MKNKKLLDNIEDLQDILDCLKEMVEGNSSPSDLLDDASEVISLANEIYDIVEEEFENDDEE
jgi:hypothetical protein